MVTSEKIKADYKLAKTALTVTVSKDENNTDSIEKMCIRDRYKIDAFAFI